MKKFIDEVISVAGKKAAYAIGRNIPLVIGDIRRRRGLFIDSKNEDRIEMTLKMIVEHPRDDKAVIEVASVVWAQSFRRKDDDFLPGEIDAASPMLPGMEGAEQPEEKLERALAESREENGPVYETLQERNLIQAAHQLGKDVFRASRPAAGQHWKRSVDRWACGEPGWQTSLCEDADQAEAALVAAENLGHIVLRGELGYFYWNGPSSEQIMVDLLKAGFAVIRRMDDSVTEFVLTGGDLEPKIHREVPAVFADQEKYLQGGGLEIYIYPEGGEK